MPLLFKWKRLLISVAIVLVLSGVSGFIALVRFIDATDREYWEEFTPSQAAQWVQREPRNSTARAVLAMHLWNQRDYDKAIAEFRTESALDPQNYSSHEFIAEILEEQGKREQARKEWKIVAEMAPSESFDWSEAQQKR